MMQSVRFTQRSLLSRAAILTILLNLVTFGMPLSAARSQEATQTGSLAGRVTDEQGNPVVGAQVFIQQIGRGAQTRASGDYLLQNSPAGTHPVRARIIGYRMQTATVTVTAGERTTQDFSLTRDPLSLGEVVVTGTVTPR